MSGVGRGRGRGRGAMNYTEAPRPGLIEQAKTQENKQENMQESRETLQFQKELNEISIYTPDLRPFMSTVKNYAATESNLDEIAKRLYQRCQKDWQFSRLAAIVCSELANEKWGEKKFRDCVLRTIQQDFKNREALRKESNKKFLGCVAFLCQVYCHMKTSTGEPMSVLVNPLMQAFELILDADTSEEEMNCAAKQLLCCGPQLFETEEKRLTQTVNLVRNCILDNRGTVCGRLRLLDVIEANASEWTIHVET